MLGCVLYELTTLEKPFYAENINDLINGRAMYNANIAYKNHNILRSGDPIILIILGILLCI